MWVTYEISRRILFPEGATTVGSEVFESPIWDTWTICNLDPHQDKYRTLAVKNFQIWSLTLDPIQSSTVWTYKPLLTYGHFFVETHHSNVRKTLLWLFATLLCWFRTTKYLLGKCYFFIALIKQAPIVHRILYSFCEICNITKRKSIRNACIEFYLSLGRSI